MNFKLVIKRISYTNIKSCLFVPGNQEKMLKKSYNINTHILVPDLEDSVPITEKQNAAEMIKSHLLNMKSTQQRLIFPRLNSFQSGFFESDLNNLITKDSIQYIDGLIIPKLSTPEDFNSIHEKILTAERKFNKEKPLKFIAWIESTLGLVNLKDILVANTKLNRLIGLAFGAEDFTNDFQIERKEHLKNIEVPRSVFAFTVHAFGLIPFDTPYVEFKNTEGLIEDINYVKSIGFKGKFAIHPSQVEIINQCFSPSSKEVEEARSIKEAFENSLKEGKASLSLNGKMVDYPVYKRALNVLDRAN
jgi:citrate lyase subunit beta/citryl-CoA lyase